MGIRDLPVLERRRSNREYMRRWRRQHPEQNRINAARYRQRHYWEGRLYWLLYSWANYEPHPRTQLDPEERHSRKLESSRRSQAKKRRRDPDRARARERRHYHLFYWRNQAHELERRSLTKNFGTSRIRPSVKQNWAMARLIKSLASGRIDRSTGENAYHRIMEGESYAGYFPYPSAPQGRHA